LAQAIWLKSPAPKCHREHLLPRRDSPSAALATAMERDAAASPAAAVESPAVGKGAPTLLTQRLPSGSDLILLESSPKASPQVDGSPPAEGKMDDLINSFDPLCSSGGGGTAPVGANAGAVAAGTFGLPPAVAAAFASGGPAAPLEEPKAQSAEKQSEMMLKAVQEDARKMHEQRFGKEASLDDPFQGLN